jgi:hypothetical protein
MEAVTERYIQLFRGVARRRRGRGSIGRALASALGFAARELARHIL